MNTPSSSSKPKPKRKSSSQGPNLQRKTLWKNKMCVPWQQALRNRRNLKAAYQKQPHQFGNSYQILPLPGSDSAKPISVAEFLRITEKEEEDNANTKPQNKPKNSREEDDDDEEEYIPDPAELLMGTTAMSANIYPLQNNGIDDESSDEECHGLALALHGNDVEFFNKCTKIASEGAIERERIVAKMGITLPNAAYQIPVIDDDNTQEEMAALKHVWGIEHPNLCSSAAHKKTSW